MLSRRTDITTTSDWLISNPSTCAAPDDATNAWWSAEFDRAYNIKKVKILAPNHEGYDFLALTKIYISGQFCGILPANINRGTWFDTQCQGEGIVGTEIMLKNNHHYFAFCGIKVYAGADYEN